MHINSIRMGLEPIVDRLLMPHEVKFSNRNLISEPHLILQVNPEKIFFVSPALFLWIDSGIQSFNGITSSPKDIKLIETLVCKTPIMEFKDIDKKYSQLLMISNLTFNPNLKSVKEMETEVNYLKGYIQKAKEFFTGEHYHEVQLED